VAVSGAIAFAFLNRSGALAARARTSISAVAATGVGVSSGMSRAEAVVASALHSEVLQKKEGEKPAPKINPMGMYSMRWSTVANAGAMSGWYTIWRKAALISSLYISRS
jgi:hypothetical protein